MAKLTKEEVQALLRVVGATTYITRKHRETISECDGEIRNWVHVTYTVEIWYGRHTEITTIYKSTGKGYITTRVKAWSRDEDTAWRNAYMKFIKAVDNDG